MAPRKSDSDADSVESELEAAITGEDLERLLTAEERLQFEEGEAALYDLLDEADVETILGRGE